MDKREKILFASEHKRALRMRTVKEREYTILPDRITDEKVLFILQMEPKGRTVLKI